MLELFNTLNALRLEIADRGKILGIIRDGGDQAIYIPDHCSAEFTIRSFSMKYKLELVDRFLEICRHLAELTHTRFEYEPIALSYEDIRNNPVLEELLANNFTALGETVKPRDKEMGIGCTDMGNLTHLFPGLQSYVRLARGVPIRRNFWRLPQPRKATGHCRGGLRPGDDGGGYPSGSGSAAAHSRSFRGDEGAL